MKSRLLSRVLSVLVFMSALAAVSFYVFSGHEVRMLSESESEDYDLTEYLIPMSYILFIFLVLRVIIRLRMRVKRLRRRIRELREMVSRSESLIHHLSRRGHNQEPTNPENPSTTVQGVPVQATPTNPQACSCSYYFPARTPNYVPPPYTHS